MRGSSCHTPQTDFHLPHWPILVNVDPDIVRSLAEASFLGYQMLLDKREEAV